MTEINIYKDEYRQQVSDLILDIQCNEFGVPITLDEQPDLKDIPGFYQKVNGNFWIVVNDNLVVGTIALLDTGNSQGALRKMFVHKAYRGKEFGVGQKLLSTLLAWAKHKDYTGIFLGTTEKFVAAQRFYEKNGFIEIDKRLLPAAFPVMAVDVKFYKYIIPNE